MKNMNIVCKSDICTGDFGGNWRNFANSTQKSSGKWILCANFVEISEISEIALIKLANNVRFEPN